MPALGALDGLEFIGHNENNPFHLMHAEIVGNLVYVSEGLGAHGVEVYDITDPASIVQLEGPAARQVGDRARLADGPPPTWRTRAYPERGLLLGFSHLEGVQHYDISGGIDLAREYDPPAGISYEGGALLDDHLFVAAHQHGVDLLDMSEPGPISLLATIDLVQNAAWDVEVVGEHLLVANGRFGLAVVDLTTDPPELVATVPIPGLASDLIVSGSIAYVSLGPDGLAAFDVSLPASPLLLDHNTETEGNVTTMGLLGDLLVTGSWTRLELYDVSNPSDLTRIGADGTKTWAMGADIGNTLEDPIIVVADWRGISTYRPGSDQGPDFGIDPPRIDFGFVSTEIDTLVIVSNFGEGTLEVTNTIPPTGFTVQPSSFSVPPGSSQEVTVTVSGSSETRDSIRYLTNDPDEASVRQYVYKNNNAFPQIGGRLPTSHCSGPTGSFIR